MHTLNIQYLQDKISYTDLVREIERNGGAEVQTLNHNFVSCRVPDGYDPAITPLRGITGVERVWRVD